MENFNVPDIASLNTRGLSIPADNGFATTQIVTMSDTTPAGTTINRRGLRITYTIGSSGGSGQLYGLPFPANGEGYMSFRLRVNNNGSARMVAFRLNMIAAATNGVNTTFWYMNSNLFGPTSNGQQTSAQPATFNFAYDKFYTVEIYRSATGAYKVWLDDFLLQAPAGTSIVTPATAGFLYLLVSNVTTVSPPPAITVDMLDFVSVDLSNPGLQYRPGRTSRILPVAATADVITEWTGGDGTAHYSQLSDFTNTVNATGYITANVVGKREQYQQGGVLAGFESLQQVLSVGAESYLGNFGGASHTLTTEANFGAGTVSTGDIMLAPTGSYVYRPLYLDKKPDGSNWTIADLSTVKTGFSIKS
jgi:hypothetical protein